MNVLWENFLVHLKGTFYWWMSLLEKSRDGMMPTSLHEPFYFPSLHVQTYINIYIYIYWKRRPQIKSSLCLFGCALRYHLPSFSSSEKANDVSLFTRHIHTNVEEKIDNYFIFIGDHEYEKAVHKCTLNEFTYPKSKTQIPLWNAIVSSWINYCYMENGFKDHLLTSFAIVFKVEVRISLRKCLVNYKYFTCIHWLFMLVH